MKIYKNRSSQKHKKIPRKTAGFCCFFKLFIGRFFIFRSFFPFGIFLSFGSFRNFLSRSIGGSVFVFLHLLLHIFLLDFVIIEILGLVKGLHIGNFKIFREFVLRNSSYGFDDKAASVDFFKIIIEIFIRNRFGRTVFTYVPESCRSNVTDDKGILTAMGAEGKELAPLLENPLTAVSLCEHNSLTTAYGNDRCPDTVFAQQLLGHGKKGDVLIALTTSGNSKNCVYAATLAKAMGISVISVTGALGGKISTLADVAIKLDESETYLVQELTLPLYHYLCAELEKHFFA
jgi:hypothetical protein